MHYCVGDPLRPSWASCPRAHARPNHKWAYMIARFFARVVLQNRAPQSGPGCENLRVWALERAIKKWSARPLLKRRPATSETMHPRASKP
eukprot:10135132-Alexandrium_andersonii.AAC.1